MKKVFQEEKNDPSVIVSQEIEYNEYKDPVALTIVFSVWRQG